MNRVHYGHLYKNTENLTAEVVSNPEQADWTRRSWKIGVRVNGCQSSWKHPFRQLLKWPLIYRIWLLKESASSVPPRAEGSREDVSKCSLERSLLLHKERTHACASFTLTSSQLAVYVLFPPVLFQSHLGGPALSAGNTLTDKLLYSSYSDAGGVWVKSQMKWCRL